MTEPHRWRCSRCNRRRLTRCAPQECALVVAARRLAAWDDERTDDAYPLGDPRRTRPDAEMAPEWFTERERLARAVVTAAALASGASPGDAEIYADTYESPSNPHNLTVTLARVRLLSRPEQPAAPADTI